MRRPRARAGGFALALALAACGQQGDRQVAGARGAGSPGATQEALLQFDPCARKGPWEGPFCARDSLRAVAGELAEAFAAEARELSREGVRQLVQDQTEWAKAALTLCGVDAGAGEMEAAACLQAAAGDRLKDADQAVEQIGGFTFQRVEAIAATPIPPGALPDAIPLDGAPAVSVVIEYPRIDAPQGPAVERFNTEAVQAPVSRPVDYTEETVRYSIVHAGPALVSVRFDTYNLPPGGAHPNTGAKALNVVMATGELLRAEDVFEPGSGWEEFLTERAAESLTQDFAELGESDGPPREAVRDAIAKPHLWTISETGLTILFPAYSLGGPYAVGDQEARFSWADLKAYLRPNAPAPISAS